MANTKPAFLHILKTKSLKSDGRVLKWIKSLEGEGYRSSVFVLEDSNNTQQWVEEGNVYQTFRLRWRDFFSKGRGYIFKVPEAAFKILKYIKRSPSSIVVIHDSQHYLVLLILTFFKNYFQKKVIWDLHELPHQAMIRWGIPRYLLRQMLRNTDLLIYTNEHRRNYMIQHIGFNEKNWVILNNHVDKSFRDLPKTTIPSELGNWLGNDRRYILWLGEASVRRNFLTVLESLKQQDFSTPPKIVVLGKVDPEVHAKIVEAEFEGNVYSTFVTQDEMINYIDNASYSIVLYKNVSPNNFYCEPNRLYQLLSRRIPVICGNNPPLASSVREFRGGVVLKDDGSDADILADAIRIMGIERDAFKSSLESKENKIFPVWENQFGDVLTAIRKSVL